MASISNAGAVFGKYSIENNIMFDIPMIGRVYIGMSLLDLLKSVLSSAKIQYELDQNGRVYTFQVNDDLSLVCVVNGKCITEIRYDNIQNLIDLPLLYTHNGKTYITNVSSEGYMLRVVNLNKVKLEKITDVPNILIHYDIDNQKSVTKRETEDLIKYFNKCQERGKSLPRSEKAVEELEDYSDRYSELNARREELLKEYRQLRYKVNSQKDYIADLREKLIKAEEPHNRAIGGLLSTFGEALHRTTVSNLVRAGKLQENEDGTYSLVEGSRTPDTKNTYWDHRLEHTSFVDLGMLSRYQGAVADGKMPKHDVNEDYIFEDNSTSYSKNYTVARAYLRTDVQRDEMYLAAAEWLRCHDTQYFTRKVKEAYVKVKEIKDKLKAAEEEQKRLSSDPEYIAACVRFTEVGNQINNINTQIKELEAEISAK